eukprot:CAMPEP_0181241034 /NCGR_PEP_ID=MMETSP1096-20121128/40876_1 /TAXON_ID=156174 ORGANISM="Chrysochromulina ericina, Strain CCMP281" /NCGR_SAMPLE_ID=MMETSP1096 /ASSEMBLY_ACC=CAM_ASM_000453 /LENGTH=94 /DNA_ID=CAMNT_0023337019 /DNA_START=592 /DNA_END=872 /DNA_ORIENTATION=+
MNQYLDAVATGGFGAVQALFPPVEQPDGVCRLRIASLEECVVLVGVETIAPFKRLLDSLSGLLWLTQPPPMGSLRRAQRQAVPRREHVHEARVL